jgi:hypothetical protein
MVTILRAAGSQGLCYHNALINKVNLSTGEVNSVNPPFLIPGTLQKCFTIIFIGTELVSIALSI